MMAPTTLKVLVAPSAGRLRLLPPTIFRDGFEWVEPGQPVARVEQRRGDTILLAPVGGRVAAVLGLEGEPVAPGQPVLAIDPDVEAERSGAT
jgi:biotin carboxyl carrier protein